MPDFNVSFHGSIVIITPLTPAAVEWVGEHIPDDAPRWAGGVAVEHRYAGDVINGIESDGLMIEED